MKQYGIDAIPAKHEKLNDWRINFTGVQFLHEKTNLLLFGAIDDLWINPDNQTNKTIETIQLFYDEYIYT